MTKSIDNTICRCIIAIGDNGRWCVLNRPEPNEELSGLLDNLKIDEKNQSFIFDDTSPGVYLAVYNNECNFENLRSLWVWGESDGN